MLIGRAGGHLAASGPEVSAVANGQANSRTNLTCYAGAQFNQSGVEYESNVAGVWNQSQGNWLDSGLASEVWVERVITSGTWNFSDPGAGRHVLSTTRNFQVRRTSGGTQTVQGYFKFWDAASSGNLLQQTAGATWSAEYVFDACPTCCFTPETPVMMASGIEMPIGKVQVGDMIRTQNGPEAVTAIITRVNRAMFRLHFHDGSHIDTSDDHPFDVKGEPKSLNHYDTEYKDLGLPAQLQLGDWVSTAAGDSVRIVDIERIEYPGTVYTFANSLFYANGLLVY